MKRILIMVAVLLTSLMAWSQPSAAPAPGNSAQVVAVRASGNHFRRHKRYKAHKAKRHNRRRAVHHPR